MFAEVFCPALEDGRKTVQIPAEIAQPQKVGYTYRYECLAGYETSHPTESICLSAGDWSISAPNCSGRYLALKLFSQNI